ncbi:MAG: hypothetical protein AAF663_02710 [Planctomycetota bacterium]
MTSLIQDQPKKFRVSYTCPVKKRRRTLYLTNFRKRDAQVTKLHSEALVSSKLSASTPPAKTTIWLSKIAGTLHEKISNLDLCDAWVSTELGTFLSEYVENHPTAKKWTRTNLDQAVRYLLEHFAPQTAMGSITPAEADEWRRAMLNRKLAESTIRRATGRARQFFNAAVELGLIPSNAFDHLPATEMPNRSRDYFVTRDEIEKVLEACPDARWRLLIALCRFGGLRCPSETTALR